MPRPKLTAAQKEKATLTKIKAGKSRATRGAVNELERRLKKGESIADLEKKLTSKEIKDVLNAVNERRYGKDFVRIGRYYKSTSKAAKSLAVFRAVKLDKGAMGWMTAEGRIWLKGESVEILNSLDGIKGMGRGTDTLINKWSMANAEQKARISEYLSNFDWDKVFEDLYPSDKSVVQGDQVAKRRTFLAEIHATIDKILAS